MWEFRLLLAVLMGGALLESGVCMPEDYFLDMLRVDPVILIDNDVEEVPSLRLGEPCNSPPVSIPWFPVSFPPLNGTCYATAQNCTTAGGGLMYQGDQKCPGNEVCCFNAQNATMPTVPTMSTPSFTFPTMGVPNCTTPNAPSFDPSNPSGGGGGWQPPNCTTPAMPTAPSFPTLSTTPSG